MSLGDVDGRVKSAALTTDSTLGTDACRRDQEAGSAGADVRGSGRAQLARLLGHGASNLIRVAKLGATHERASNVDGRKSMLS